MNHICSAVLSAVCIVLGFSQLKAQTPATFAKDGFRYTVLADHDVSVAYNDEDSIMLEGRVVIPTQVMHPETTEVYNVVALADTAFKGCDLIETLVLPPSVKKVGHNIVDNCFNLKAYEVQPGSGSFKAVDGVLFSADGAVLVSCPSGKSGSYTFPASVTSIAPSAFATCKNFSQITFNEGLKEIPDYAFYECWGLAQVQFPQSLEKIGDYAFDGTILQFLYFYKNLKSIGSHAFNRSSMVECICLSPVPAQLGTDVFGDDMMYTRLYVPAGTQSKYARAGWNVFPIMYPGSKSHRWKGTEK